MGHAGIRTRRSRVTWSLGTYATSETPPYSSIATHFSHAVRVDRGNTTGNNPDSARIRTRVTWCKGECATYSTKNGNLLQYIVTSTFKVKGSYNIVHGKVSHLRNRANFPQELHVTQNVRQYP